MTRLNKKYFVSLILVFTTIITSLPFTFGRVDEGMYTPDKIKDLSLAKRGLKIKPGDIYDPKNGGISEAIIRLDSGCTGEFISGQGLILTNHHCGYDALVSASTKERNFAEIGFKAQSIKEEIPAKDYSISIPIRVEDVTSKITAGTASLTGAALSQAIAANISNLETEESKRIAEGNTVSVRAVSNGYFYYLYENKQLKDIRVVYAPPSNIGIFGGDPDNFEWTRHTGDFTFLRAYVSPDAKSAEYSPNNVPFKPRKFLTISFNGVKENDFVFIMGNPGGTTRYRESQSIHYAETVNFPFLYRYLTAWIGGLEKVGAANEDKRIALQSRVASLRNAQKLYRGGAIALRRGGAAELRRSDETKFQSWANSSPARKAEYGNILGEISEVWTETNPTPARDRLLRTLPSLANSPVYRQVIDAFTAVKNGDSLSDKKRQEIAATLASWEPLVERDVLRYLFRDIRELPTGERFAAADNILSKAGAEDSLITQLIDSKDFDSAEKIIAIYAMSLDQIRSKWGNLADLALAHGNELSAIGERNGNFATRIDPLRLKFMSGMIKMKGVTPYPDANFTQRFTFGNIKGYKPREAVIYTPFTSLKGILEKDTGVFPFNAPDKIRELQNKKDFGRYASGDSVPVNFLSSNDIIGGNSGSPVLNAYGEQVGLVFDGNYEGLGNDLFFSPEYGRTISVDIRYVFFIAEKFDNMSWILKEIKIAGPKSDSGMKAKAKRKAA